MKNIVIILFFVVSILGASTVIDANSSIKTENNTTITNTVVKKVEKVTKEVTDTLKVATSVGDTDTAFQYILYKLNEFFKSHNLYFEIFKLDSAKLILILIILGSSWFLRFLISKIIEFIFRFYKKESEDLIFKLVDSVKVPFLWFLIFFSIYWSIKVYVYPEILNKELVAAFSTIHLFTGAWLIWNILENYKNIVIAKKNRRLKVEEVELITISLKILLIAIVFLITIYMYWPETLKYISIGSFAVAYAMKDSVASYFAAFKLVTDLDFSIGDWIKIADVNGDIISIGLFYTKVRDFENGLVLVPNSELIKNPVINYSRRQNRRVKFFFYLPINIESNKIQVILDEVRNIVRNHPDIMFTKNNKFDSRKKMRIGQSDTQLVNLVDVEHGNKIMIYCYTTKNDWKQQLYARQDIILKIKKILEKHNCSMIIEAKYLQDPFYNDELANNESENEKNLIGRNK